MSIDFQNNQSQVVLLTEEDAIAHYDFEVDDDEKITFSNIQIQIGINLVSVNDKTKAYILPALEEDAAETFKKWKDQAGENHYD